MMPLAGQWPILLVENDPLERDLTLRALRRCRLLNPLRLPGDGQEALEFIPRWAAGEALPVVALLVLKLPRVDALKLLRLWRASPVSATLPVVVLTSSDQDRDVPSAHRPHANSSIVKPVDFDKFTEVAGQIGPCWCLLNQPPC